MDGSDHSRISSPTPIKRSSTAKLPSATCAGENEQSNQQMGTNLQNSKKPMTKNFMSPTISASSKAIAPRKKILSERNEISDTPNIDNSEGSLSLNSDSALSPDYPLPRPKFLRYKPNRRRDIVSSSENEAKGKIPLPFKDDKEVGSICSSPDGKEIDEEDEEVEEEEEKEEEGLFRRALKLMLVLMVLVSSTIYISSMNSPEVSSHTLQAKEGLKYGYLKIHSHVYRAMRRLGGEDQLLKKLEVGNELLGGNLGFMKVNQTVLNGECVGEEMFEDVYKGAGEEISVDLSVEAVGLQVGDGEIEDENKTCDGDLSDMVVELQAGDEKDALDQMVENFDLETETIVDSQIPAMSIGFEQENEHVLEPATEVNKMGDGDLEMVKSEMTEIENVIAKASEVFMSDSMDTKIASLVEILNSEADSQLKDGLIEQIEIDILLKAVIGVATILAIVAPFVLAFQLKRRSNATKDSCSIIIKPCTNKFVVAEKCNSVLPTEREDQHLRSIDSFAIESPPISMISSTIEDSKDWTQSCAPAVELLGEFVVGDISSSFRSHVKKSKMEEREVSNYSFSFDKGFNSSKSPNHDGLLDFSEQLSAMDISSSHEELFTPQKKKMKNEVGRDGDSNKVSTTSVRRSSRIRNRAITSP